MSQLAAWEVVSTVRLRALESAQLDGNGLILNFTSSDDPSVLAQANGLVLISADLIDFDFNNADALRVVLHADRLVDSKGRPLDGHFVGGQLPTGKATPGGTFTSWFTLKP
jgi:hypothetical protein